MIKKIASLLALSSILSLGFLLAPIPGYAKEIEVTTVAELVDCANGTTSEEGDVCLVRFPAMDTPDGEYNLSGDLSVTVRNLTVRCADGPLACVIDLNGDNSIVLAADRVTFGGPGSGFLLKNNGGPMAAEAFLISGVRRGITIQGNRIEGSFGSGVGVGIEIANTQRFLRVIENEIINPQDQCVYQGPSAGGLIDAEFRGNRCVGAGDSSGERGLEFLGNEDFINVRITGGSECEVTGAQGDGIAFDLTVNHQRIINLYVNCNVSFNGSNGLLVLGGDGNPARVDFLGAVIEDSVFQGNQGSGALLLLNPTGAGGGRIKDVVCRRSDFLQNEHDGFRIQTLEGGADIQNVEMDDCRALDNGTKVGDHGFEIEARTTVSNVEFSTVVAKGNFDSGIRIATASGSGEDIVNVNIGQLLPIPAVALSASVSPAYSSDAGVDLGYPEDKVRRSIQGFEKALIDRYRTIIGTLTASSARSIARSIDIDICELVDTSGSIDDKELGLEVNGFKNALQEVLLPAVATGKVTVRIAIVGFADSATTFLPLTEVTPTTQKTIEDGYEALLNTSDRGWTNMAAGINRCYDILSQSTASRRVIDLATDGEPTRPEADPRGAATAAATAAKNDGIEIWTMGIGNEADNDFLANNIAGCPPQSPDCGARNFPVREFKDFSRAIIKKTRRTILKPNTISDNLRHGILIESNRNIFGLAIGGNAINGNGAAGALGQGIRIHALNAGVRNTRIESNTISDNGEGGIEIQANNEISSTSILQNRIRNNPRFGIRLVTSTPAPLSGPAVLVSGNTINGNTRCGTIDDAGTFALNDLTQAEGIGLLIDAKNVEVRKNRIVCNEIGIKVAKSESVSIRQNNILNNERFGVDATLVSPEMVDATQNWWGTGGPFDPPLPNANTGNVDDSNPLSEGIADVPDPFVIIGDVQLNRGSIDYLPIVITEVPEPGVASFQVGPEGALTFDPSVIQVTEVIAVSPYQVLSMEIDNDLGEVRFAITNPTGENYLIGDGPIVSLTIEAAPGASVGDSTVVTITKVDKLEAPGGTGGQPLVTTIFPGRVSIVPANQRKRVAEEEGSSAASGDVNQDGSLDVTDARLVAEAAIGLRTLSKEEAQRADVAPPFGIIDITDARFLAEAALGLRAVSLSLSEVQSTPQGLWDRLLSWLGLFPRSVEVRLSSAPGGVRLELPASVVEAQGELQYDPEQGEALRLEGEGSWVVLAQALDPAEGTVKFAAVRLPSGQGPGALVLRTSEGRITTAWVRFRVLRDAKGNDLAYQVRWGTEALRISQMQVLRAGDGLRFRVQQPGVQALGLEVYDLSGRTVYESGWVSGRELSWSLRDSQGSRVANGVYLYVVRVRTPEGAEVRTSIQKLLVLR